MKKLSLIACLIALSSCKTTYWQQPNNDLEVTECNGKPIDPQTQECLIESERERRSYGVR
jgi:hypothetical protein